MIYLSIRTKTLYKVNKLWHAKRNLSCVRRSATPVSHMLIHNWNTDVIAILSLMFIRWRRIGSRFSSLQFFCINNDVCFFIWCSSEKNVFWHHCPDSKVHGTNMGPTWVLSAPDGPHVGPMNLSMKVVMYVPLRRISDHWDHQQINRVATLRTYDTGGTTNYMCHTKVLNMLLENEAIYLMHADDVH